MSRIPIWAVLVPATASWLEAHAMEELREDDPDAATSAVQVIAGRDRYAAVVTYDPCLTDAERPLAERLAQLVDGTVYAIRPIDAVDLGPEGDLVWCFSRGGAVEELKEEPFTLAERLGCPLRPARTGPPVVRSVVLVEGVAPEVVRAALAGHPLLPALEIRANRRGSLVSAPRGNGVDSSDIRAALPAAPVYDILSGPKPERFAVHVRRGRTRVGAFEADGTQLPGVPALDGIDGERTRAGILAALDVPPALLEPR